MWKDNYGLTWEDEWKLFVEVMNTLDLPDPENGEEIWDYMYRIEEKFKGLELPEPFEGELFNFVGAEDFGNYLTQYRNMYIEEQLKYTVWRK